MSTKIGEAYECELEFVGAMLNKLCPTGEAKHIGLLECHEAFREFVEIALKQLETPDGIAELRNRLVEARIAGTPITLSYEYEFLSLPEFSEDFVRMMLGAKRSIQRSMTGHADAMNACRVCEHRSDATSVGAGKT